MMKVPEQMKKKDSAVYKINKNNSQQIDLETAVNVERRVKVPRIVKLIKMKDIEPGSTK